jgi:membrane protein implicated in regulation of membrane protease activity
MTFVWIAVALAFGVAEMLTLAFYAIFLVVGGLAAAVAAQLGVPQVGQVIVFCLVSIAGVVAARPPMMRYLQRRGGPGLLSGAQSMIGVEAPVVDEIVDAHHPGHVRIAGENWPAVSRQGTLIPAGSTVRVDGLRQATLIVTLVNAPAPAPGPAAEAPPAASAATSDTTLEG